MSASTRHLVFLDGVRGWAAFAVFFYHLRIDRPETSLLRAEVPQPVLDAIVEGKHGVAVFFVLSGLVIAYSLREHLDPPPNRDSEPAFDFFNFSLRRTIRLTPPYHAAIIVALVFAYGAAVEGGHDYLPGGEPFSAPRLLSHLVYAQEFFGFTNFNDVFWTLSIELQFYVVFGLLVAANGVLSRLRLTASTLPALYAVSAGASLIWPFGLAGGDRRAIWFLPVWYSFMLGVLVFARWRRQIPAWALAAYLALLALSPFVAGYGGAFAWVSVATAVLLWTAVELDRLGRWLADPVSQFLGRVSYSLYLIHTPVLGASFVVTAKLLGEPTLGNQLLGLLTTVVVTLAASEAFHRAVERPAIVLSRRLKKDRPQAEDRQRSPNLSITP